MLMGGYRLGVDYGTSNTVAVVRSADGRVRPLLFDGAPLLPSAVFAAADGRLFAGRDAVHGGRGVPARFEPNPKHRIDEPELLLGDTPVPLEEIVAATLRQVRAECVRVTGGPPAAVTMAYPAGWGAVRRTVLVRAASAAGLPSPTLVPEPVAAAAYFTTVLGHRVGPGQVLVVYDLGAGTFDVSVVRRTADGYDVCDVDGMTDFGGVDIDAMVVARVGAVLASVAPAEWRRISTPGTPAEQRHFRALWDEARSGKEMLSRQSSVDLHVPLVERDIIVTRDELEAAAGPRLERAAQLTMSLMRRVGAGDELAGIFLVGGASRMPLVATTLHRVTGIAPTVLDQPEMVVAEGAVRSAVPGMPAVSPASPALVTPAAAQSASRAAAQRPDRPAAASQPQPGPGQATHGQLPPHGGPLLDPPTRGATPRRGRRIWIPLVAAFAAALVAAGVTAYAVVPWNLLPFDGDIVSFGSSWNDVVDSCEGNDQSGGFPVVTCTIKPEVRDRTTAARVTFRAYGCNPCDNYPKGDNVKVIRGTDARLVEDDPLVVYWQQVRSAGSSLTRVEGWLESTKKGDAGKLVDLWKERQGKT